MLYHPQSPFFQQFLTAGARMNRRMDGAVSAQPVPSAASAAQAKAANMEK